MLAESFKLALHHDQTPKPVYALVVRGAFDLSQSTMEDLANNLSGAVQGGIARRLNLHGNPAARVKAGGAKGAG
ncbi:MAG: hypothetical protein ABSG03_11230 [Bryobacteraceae bacterium]|jgi:uncharacterized protein (TIGR03435 family)